MERTLIILCGGKSTRLGTDKALLPFGDSCMIEYVVNRFLPDFPHIYLSVQQKGDYAHLKLPVTEIQDMYLNAGPIGGIFSSLSMIDNERAFVMSIDTPFLEPELAVYMTEKSKGYDICTLSDTAEFPLDFCGVYSKNCIPGIGKNILLRQYSLRALSEKAPTVFLTEEELMKHLTKPLSPQLHSVCTRGQYYDALRMLHEKEPELFQETS